MFTSVPVATTVSAVFVVLAVIEVLGLLRHRHRGDAVVGRVLHLVMTLDMAAMCWPQWTALPVWPQLGIFIFGTGWYAIRMALTLRPRGQAGARHRFAHGAHLAMMAAMVWMIVVMTPTDAGEGGHHHSLAAAPALMGTALVACMLTAAALEVVDLIEQWGRHHTVRSHSLADLFAAPTMNAAMAATALTMIVN